MMLMLHPADLNVDLYVDFDASSVELVLNEDIVHGINDAALVLPGNFKKLQDSAIASVLSSFLHS